MKNQQQPHKVNKPPTKPQTKPPALRDPYTAFSLAAFLIAAYICLFNLDYAPFWHDESVVSFIGKNLLLTGDISGWDGRSLVGGPNGNSLNARLQDIAPPVQYGVTAAGFALFGFNETGARIFHALLGVLALGVFYLILRQRLPQHPRLVFFIFLFTAGSAQLLLFFRQARYYSATVLCMLACLYFYERYWRSKNPAWLAALSAAAALAFFSHYAVGTSALLALGAWHLLFRARQTTAREWAAFAGCGLLAGMAGIAYLLYIGLLGGGRNVVAGFSTGDYQYSGAMPLPLLKIWVCARDLIAADWISWPVFIWFIAMLMLALHARRQSTPRPRISGRRGRKKRRKAPTPDAALPLAAVAQILALAFLFALFSALISRQPVWLSIPLDLRYFVAGLPLLLTMKGLFAEWLWRKSPLAGALAIVALLFTSAGAAPFNMTNIYRQSTLGFPLFSLLREIHQPYRNTTGAVSDYLLQHARQDDTVYVPNFDHRDEIIFYTGHRVRFVCALSGDSPLPRDLIESLDARLYDDGCDPDWIIYAGRVPPEYRDRIENTHAPAVALDVAYPSANRGELGRHAFTPPPMRGGVSIFRRKGG